MDIILQKFKNLVTGEIEIHRFTDTYTLNLFTSCMRFSHELVRYDQFGRIIN
jgi:hypothetical protein